MPYIEKLSTDLMKWLNYWKFDGLQDDMNIDNLSKLKSTFLGFNSKTRDSFSEEQLLPQKKLENCQALLLNKITTVKEQTSLINNLILPENSSQIDLTSINWRLIRKIAQEKELGDSIKFDVNLDTINMETQMAIEGKTNQQTLVDFLLGNRQFTKFLMLYCNQNKMPFWKVFTYENLLDNKNAILVLKAGLVSNNANSYAYIEKFYKFLDENYLMDSEKSRALIDSKKFDNFLDSLLKEDKILTKQKTQTLKQNPLYHMRIYSGLIKLLDKKDYRDLLVSYKLKQLINTPYNCYKKDAISNYQIIKNILDKKLSSETTNPDQMSQESPNTKETPIHNQETKFCVILLEKIYKQDKSIVEADLTIILPRVIRELVDTQNKYEVAMLVSGLNQLVDISDTQLVSQPFIREAVQKCVDILKCHHKRIIRRYSAYVLSLWVG